MRREGAPGGRASRTRRTQQLTAGVTPGVDDTTEDAVDVRGAEQPIDLTARLPGTKERPRILVVDDEPDVRDWLRIALHEAGWSVNTAPSASEGLEMAMRLRPRVVVLDQSLPDANGVDVARWLRANHPDIIVLLFSAYLDLRVEEEATRLGVCTISKVDHQSLMTNLAALRDVPVEQPAARRRSR